MEYVQLHSETILLFYNYTVQLFDKIVRLTT